MTSREWMNRAACRDHDPELWFSTTSSRPGVRPVRANADIAKALTICFACPVMEQCGEHADELQIGDGIWGGKIRSGGRFQHHYLREIFAHGTEAGYKRHHRRGEKPCKACREANSRARAARSDRKLRENT